MRRSSRCSMILSAIVWFAWSVQARVGAEDWAARSQLAIGHNHRVIAAIFSPDSKTIVSGDSEGERFVFWNVESGRIQSTVSDPLLQLTVPIGFTADGKQLILVSSRKRQNRIMVWNIEMQSVSVLGVGGLPANLSPNRRWLAIQAGSQHLSSATVNVWDLESGRVAAKFTPANNGGDPNSKRMMMQHVAFSPDSQSVAALYFRQDLLVWDLNTKELLKTFPPSQEFQHHLVFDPRGQIQTLPPKYETASADRPNALRESFIRDIAYSADGKHVARLFAETARVEERATGRLVASCPVTPHLSHNGTVQFSPDGRFIVVADERGPILLNVSNGEERALFRRPGDVRSLAFSPDGRQIASARANIIELWAAASPGGLVTLEGRTPQVDSVAFHPTEPLLAAGHVDGSLRVWNLKTREFQKWEGHTRPVMTLAFHSDGKTLASGSFDGTVKLWDVTTGQTSHTLSAAGPVRSLAFSPDGKILAAGNHAKSIELWSTATAEKLGTLGSHTEPVFSVAFSSDGKLLASAGNDQKLRVWNVETRACDKIIDFSPNTVWAVKFLPDGQNLVAAGEGGRLTLLKLPDAEFSTATPIKATTDHRTSQARPQHASLAISPDGHTAAIATGFLESVGLFDLPTE